MWLPLIYPPAAATASLVKDSSAGSLEVALDSILLSPTTVCGQTHMSSQKLAVPLPLRLHPPWILLPCPGSLRELPGYLPTCYHSATSRMWFMITSTLGSKPTFVQSPAFMTPHFDQHLSLLWSLVLVWPSPFGFLGCASVSRTLCDFILYWRSPFPHTSVACSFISF